MNETPEDLVELQGLLDKSFARAGSNLLSIFNAERRLNAAQLSEILVGVRVLNLATVTAKGEPRVGPVDGHFHRGRYYFGSSPESVRFRHIRARPAVSAAHTIGEQLAVIVHGQARLIDMSSPEQAGLRAQLMETYGADPAFTDYLAEHLGGDWEAWFNGASFARIDAEKMFTFSSGRSVEG
jgi:nitroimidazol reductase NimA-like FMN-containing flavoprotein (pyridoxamine 5'-phosphate oxidase superfamily)